MPTNPPVISNDNSRPLFTLALFAYRQARWVEEAVEGALAQTYSPLEIILSDDASPDETFAIMERVVARYRGPHHVVLNRNARNLGLVPHVNRVMKMAHGEMIVAAGGDDVSLPERVEETWRLWASHNGRATSIYFDVIPEFEGGCPEWRFRHDANADTLEYQARTGESNIIGASHAWHRRLFDLFGPLPPTLREEDRVLAFRSALAGQLIFGSQQLVRYRLHGNNLSARASREAAYEAKRTIRVVLLTKHKLPRLEIFRQDLRTAVSIGLLAPARAEPLMRDLAVCERLTGAEVDVYGESPLRRWQGAMRILLTRPRRGYSLSRKAYLTAVAVLLPLALRRGHRSTT